MALNFVKSNVDISSSMFDMIIQNFDIKEPLLSNKDWRVMFLHFQACC
jgi:hypothetical protein